MLNVVCCWQHHSVFEPLHWVAVVEPHQKKVFFYLCFREHGIRNSYVVTVYEILMVAQIKFRIQAEITKQT